MKNVPKSLLAAMFASGMSGQIVGIRPDALARALRRKREAPIFSASARKAQPKTRVAYSNEPPSTAELMKRWHAILAQNPY